MIKTRSAWIAVLLATTAATFAQAADLPLKAPLLPTTLTWNGFYLGISGGGDWGVFSQTNTINGISLGRFNQSGGIVGATAGYNWQTSNIVFGVETDLSWTKLYGTQACGPGSAFVCSTEMRWFGSLRGRIGAAVLDNTLLYATGGLAYGDIRATRNANATVNDNWRAGWTIGAGLETKLARDWSVKVEYLYAAFPGTATTYLITTNGTPVAAEQHRVQIVRLGVNWHF